MRQRTKASSVPRPSFDYQGQHPAGLWLRSALRCQSYAVTPLQHGGTLPLFYGVNQGVFRALHEPLLQWPLESLLQTLNADVCYTQDLSGKGAASNPSPSWLMTESTPRNWDLLDVGSILKSAMTAQASTAAREVSLCLHWDWQRPRLGHSQTEEQRGSARYWCVSGTVPESMACYGVSQSFICDGVQWYFVANPLDFGSYFTVAVWALTPQEARAQLSHCHPFEDRVFQTLIGQGLFEAEHWYDGELSWPQWQLTAQGLSVQTQWPDLRPESLRLEGVNWGLMAHLFSFLIPRYSTPEQVFERLQNFQQKIESVLKVF